MNTALNLPYFYKKYTILMQWKFSYNYFVNIHVLFEFHNNNITGITTAPKRFKYLLFNQSINHLLSKTQSTVYHYHRRKREKIPITCWRSCSLAPELSAVSGKSSSHLKPKFGSSAAAMKNISSLNPRSFVPPERSEGGAILRRVNNPANLTCNPVQKTSHLLTYKIRHKQNKTSSHALNQYYRVLKIVCNK